MFGRVKRLIGESRVRHSEQIRELHEIAARSNDFVHQIHLVKDQTTQAKWGLTGRRTANPLNTPARKYWSQSDEDGIVENIVKRLPGKSPQTFAEIGVGDGTENNSLVLLAHGWEGLWFGGEDICFTPEPDGRLTFHKVWVSLDKLGDVISPLRAFADKNGLGLLSIDLDGNDYHFLQEILSSGIQPDVLIVEYNARIPPGVEWVMPYNAEHVWAGSDYFGMSLSSAFELAARFGYFPVATSAQGANVFFVHERHRKLFSDVPTGVHELYMPPDYTLITRWGHLPSAEMLRDLTKR